MTADVPMGIPSTPAAMPDVTGVRDAIERAVDALALPGRPDLGPLERELRVCAATMLPVAETAAGQLWEGTLEWSRLGTRIGMVRHLLSQPFASGPLIAHANVFHLVADCRFLLKQLAGEPW